MREDRVKNDREKKYNACHKKMRSKIERVFGRWKKKYSVVLYVMRSNFRNAQAIIG